MEMKPAKASTTSMIKSLAWKEEKSSTHSVEHRRGIKKGQTSLFPGIMLSFSLSAKIATNMRPKTLYALSFGV